MFCLCPWYLQLPTCENNFANPLAVNVLELEGTSAAHPVKLKLAAIKISHEINS